MKTYLAPSYLIRNFSSLLASLPAVLQCCLVLKAHVHMLALVVIRKIRTRHAENTSRVIGDVTSYRMEQVILTAIYLVVNLLVNLILITGITKPCTHLHPASSTSTQLHPPPTSSFQPPPSSIHLHAALCNTLNNTWTKILHIIGQFPQIYAKKSKSCPFWQKVGTWGILEVLILNPDLHFWNSNHKIHFWLKNSKLSVLLENWCK